MNKHDIKHKIKDGWKNLLAAEFDKDYFKNLNSTLLQEKQHYEIFPTPNQVFASFNFTPLAKVKVVIIGQDPYHGAGQANGLCFSVSEGISHPPSLNNIFKEIETDLGVKYPKNGNLESWAKQGVLLLNTTLTVRKGEANSHSKIGWQQFTNKVITQLSNNKSDIIFLLWGGFAKKKTKLIDTKKNHILATGHPSPLSANRGYWFGNKHFSKTNELLIRLNKQPIDWSVE